MLERISKLIKSQKLSASQFADEIGVQRSSVSHVLSGRNKPSLDFITKIISTFPEVNTDWLLKGEGTMYVNQDEPAGHVPADEGQTSLILDNDKKEKEILHKNDHIVSSKKATGKKTAGGSKTISKIVILYEDGTFEEYSRS